MRCHVKNVFLSSRVTVDASRLILMDGKQQLQSFHHDSVFTNAMRRTRAHVDLARGDVEGVRARRKHARELRERARARGERLKIDVWWFLIRSCEVAAETQLATARDVRS